MVDFKTLYSTLPFPAVLKEMPRLAVGTASMLQWIVAFNQMLLCI